MAYYDRKRYEELRNQILRLQDFWERRKNMLEFKALIGALVLISVLYLIWRD